jgi:hypothetical protein
LLEISLKPFKAALLLERFGQKKNDFCPVDRSHQPRPQGQAFGGLHCLFKLTQYYFEPFII